MKISTNYVAMCKDIQGFPGFPTHWAKIRDRVHDPKLNSNDEAWVVSEVMRNGDVYFEDISQEIKTTVGKYYWLPMVTDLKVKCKEQQLPLGDGEEPPDGHWQEYAAKFVTLEEKWLAYLMKFGTAQKTWENGKWIDSNLRPAMRQRKKSP